ncbi:MAG: isoprenyl transferase [Alphaproteobacteria bacterium]|nr:isoprenyl transferase [Alphaproteobacteria bacterium]
MNTRTENLEHLAIIMDGNRRWAKNKGLPARAGHRQGAKTLEQICEDARDLGIKCLTLYAFSTENWGRSDEEVGALMELLREYLNGGLKKLQENNVRIMFIGERAMLAPDIAEKMHEIEENTKNNSAFKLCLAISYGSRAEIVAAAKACMNEAINKKLSPQDLDEEMFSRFLYTYGLKNPDMVVRTGGEKRISNYLLWQIAYSELYFSEVLWPDFNREELQKVINDYNQRERRYGKN